MFGEIIKSIKARIGFDAPWWGRLVRWHLPLSQVVAGTSPATTPVHDWTIETRLKSAVTGPE
jgi:hypothetical protein